MIINKAVFYTSVANISQLPEGKREIAVVGKSNVGKSSFINFLCNNSKLAKTSKTPGRTRLLNYFDINGGEFMLVDLPGYGYAKVAKEEQKKWGKLTEEYFSSSKNLKNVFMLVDIRFQPTSDDVMMMNYLYYYNIPFTVIATKADKLSRSAAHLRKREIAEFLKVGVDNVYMVSSEKKQGKEALLDRLEAILNAPDAEEDEE